MGSTTEFREPVRFLIHVACFCVRCVCTLASAIATPILLCTCRLFFNSCRHFKGVLILTSFPCTFRTNVMCKHDGIESFLSVLGMQPPVSKCCLHVIESPRPNSGPPQIGPFHLNDLKCFKSHSAAWQGRAEAPMIQDYQEVSKVIGVPPNHPSH